MWFSFEVSCAGGLPILTLRVSWAVVARLPIVLERLHSSLQLVEPGDQIMNQVIDAGEVLGRELQALDDALQVIHAEQTRHMTGPAGGHRAVAVRVPRSAHHDSAPITRAPRAVRRAHRGNTGTLLAWLGDGANADARSGLRREVPAPVLFIFSRIGGRGCHRRIAPTRT